jgi:hypothetical protein
MVSVRYVALAVAAAVLAASAGASDVEAARSATKAERAVIVQEIASFVWRKHRFHVVSVRRLRVSALPPRGGWSPTARYYYREAAAASVEAVNARGERQQAITVLLGRFMAPVPRWNVLAYGGVEVGCGLPLATFGRDRQERLLADLGLRCP